MVDDMAAAIVEFDMAVDKVVDNRADIALAAVVDIGAEAGAAAAAEAEEQVAVVPRVPAAAWLCPIVDGRNKLPRVRPPHRGAAIFGQ